MEITIDQALQQGIAAYKKGKLKEAESLFRAILQSQPAHPDANHNLGVIAVSVNKADVALPLFKTALEANPKIEQFWLSYIDALIKEQQLEAAKELIEQAKKQGVDGKKLQFLKTQLVPIPQTENANSLSPSQTQLSSLLEHYQNGRFSDAEKLAISITQEFPTHQFGWKILGAILNQTGRVSESLVAAQKAMQLMPQDSTAHYNLGNILLELGKLDEAEASFRQAIVLMPDLPEAHNNLGNTLKVLNRLDEAEVSYRQSIKLKPDYAKAHNNLGGTLQELGRLGEAEASYTQALALRPDDAEAHFNLGITLKELGRLDDAGASYIKAVALKSDYAEARNNLGNVLLEQRRLDEAEVNFRHAIKSKPNFAEAHGNLGRVLYNMGHSDLALESMEKSNHINSQADDFTLLLTVMKLRKSREENGVAVGDATNSFAFRALNSSPLILNRVVEAELIARLYEMSSRELDKTKDARYGNGTCSSDFNLLGDTCSAIQKLAEDLTKIMMNAVKSDVYIYDSFFNILGAGGGTTPHNHINGLDKDIGFNLGKQKYSLVYYLSVGDQNCSEPGILKLYDPVEDILPSEGMITIIPAGRMHSAVYGGETDRVMIGVNFYSL